METPWIDTVVTTTLTSSTPLVLGSFRSILAYPEELQPYGLWESSFRQSSYLRTLVLTATLFSALSSLLELTRTSLEWNPLFSSFSFQSWAQILLNLTVLVQMTWPQFSSINGQKLAHWVFKFSPITTASATIQKTPNLLDINFPCSTVPKVSTLHSLQSFISTISLLSRSLLRLLCKHSLSQHLKSHWMWLKNLSQKKKLA